MEFVLVTFPALRAVRMDGAQQGQTGQIIGVQRGTHRFDLGSPQDYAPPRVQAVVANTTQMQPLVIPFQPAALPVPVGGPPPGRAPMAEGERSLRAGRRSAKKAAGRKKGAGGKKAAPARKKKPARKQASRKRATKATRPGGGRSKKATRGATRRR
jgi:hypothetical protein